MDYYYFYNLTRDTVNNEIIPGYGNHNCVPQLYNLEENKTKELFQLIIKLNKWARNDEISAASDNEDNAVIIYRDDELYYVDAFEERESNLPPDDMDADEPWDAADLDAADLDEDYY